LFLAFNIAVSSTNLLDEQIEVIPFEAPDFWYLIISEIIFYY